jgi:hypothetical protein
MASNANDRVLDIRQATAMAYYKDPESETFGNVKGSLLKAGYDNEYSSSVMGQKPKWLTDYLKGNIEMLQNAEANLKKYIDLKLTIKDNKTTKSNIELAKLQTDVSKFVLKSLASGKYGKADGQQAPAVNITIQEYKAPSTMHEAEVIDTKPEV